MAPNNPIELPIAALRAEITVRAGRQPLVITSPTGSGKSTEVPRYCPGPVLVIEPRRVACRALAARVAELEDTTLGEAVGYQVRDDARCSSITRILFVTPGIALRMVDTFDRYPTIVLDEFHERGLEMDLLFAVLRQHHAQRMVVMSATLQADRVAHALTGHHLQAEGRTFPVEVSYQAGDTLLPSQQGLQERAARAIGSCLGSGHGDVLVFLPGKGEIAGVRDRLNTMQINAPVHELHGGMPLEAQAHVLRPADNRRVILATNVAETSLTVPGVTAVIDSGLVRRTRYHHGRGYLSLLPVAQDSADQRAGRAGRTGPGRCIRLWSEAAKLEPVTTPEIHRESLSPTWLAAAANHLPFEQLPFLDPPKAHALEDARTDLLALGALDTQGGLTDAGRDLFALPLDPALGRLLVQARHTPAIQDVVDLVAALSVGRPLFTSPVHTEDPDPLRGQGCDASALIHALRWGDAAQHPLARGPLQEARATARRLRQMWLLPQGPREPTPVDREQLARVAIAADPRCAHVTRTRKGRWAFSNGGTELELARDSAVRLTTAPPQALVVMDVRGVIERGRTRLYITCASPCPLGVLYAAGLGRERVGAVQLDQGRVVASIERVYAKRILGEREEVPHGDAARQAIARLFLERRLGKGFGSALSQARTRLAEHRLAHQLKVRRPRPALDWDALPAEPPELESFVPQRLQALGVEQAEDLALLAPEDLLPDALPVELQSALQENFPITLDMGEAEYQAEYDLPKQRVVLQLVRGNPSHPPRRQFLPTFPGLQVFAEAAGRLHRVK